MDGQRFDDAVKAFASRFSRRGISRAVAGSIGLSLLPSVGLVSGEAKRKTSRKKAAHRSNHHEQVRSEADATGDIQVVVLSDAEEDALAARFISHPQLDAVTPTMFALLSDASWCPVCSDAFRVFQNGQHVRDVGIKYWWDDYGNPNTNRSGQQIYGVEADGSTWGYVLVTDRVTGKPEILVTATSTPTETRTKVKGKKKKGKKKKAKWVVTPGVAWNVTQTNIADAQRTPAPRSSRKSSRSAALVDAGSPCQTCSASCSAYQTIHYCPWVAAAVCGANPITCGLPVFHGCEVVKTVLDALGSSGTCSVACSQSGDCNTCPAGPGEQRSCNGQCVDIKNSHDHCGGCNRPCPGGQACQNGQCGQACAGQIRLVLPVPQNTSVSIINGYNNPKDVNECPAQPGPGKLDHCRNQRYGLDLSASDTRLLSPVNGRIAWTPLASGGVCLGINIRDANNSLTGHDLTLCDVVVSSLRVNVGDDVQVGDCIGEWFNHIHMSIDNSLAGNPNATPLPFTCPYALQGHDLTPDDTVENQRFGALFPMISANETGGACGASCSGNQQPCNGSCVNTANNPNHCGSCNNACASGSVCEGGHCVATCNTAQQTCSGSSECCGSLVCQQDPCGGPGNRCCGQTGHSCADSCDCCDDDICSGGVCVDPGSTCLVLNAFCEDDYECCGSLFCSRNTHFSDGQHRCCVAMGESGCTRNSDCCSQTICLSNGTCQEL